MTVYMAVTPDEYEHCLCIADSKYGLSKQMGISLPNIYRHLKGEYMNDYQGVLDYIKRNGARPRTKYFIREVHITDD